MCGFSGYLERTGAVSQDAGNALLERMGQAIRHRGPDGSGTWIDDQAGVAFGHRRLAIIDLSEAGHQPMHSASGRYVIVYNGEIYNHIQLRQMVEKSGGAPIWRGHSDTETLLAAIERWGLSETLRRSRGMFGLALWDREERTLSLARDRLGEKPVYYGWQSANGQRAFLFGSDLGALRLHPAFSGEIDRGALTLYMRHLAVPTPFSIYKGIAKLQPGHIAILREGCDEPAIEAYWDASARIAAARAAPFAGTPMEAVDALEKKLGEAVGLQMIADVPLGAFLSGGIDSSTIVALMQARATGRVRTFSIGFDDTGFDEAVYAKQVAHHLGTDHTELYLRPSDALQIVDSLPAIYTEPFADSSQLPTHLVSKMASEHVTVALSGDAGDELFAGYNRYALTSGLWRWIARLPTSLRGGVAKAIGLVGPAAAQVPPFARQFARAGEMIAKGAPLIASRSTDELYLAMVSTWKDPAALVLGGHEPATRLTDPGTLTEGLSGVERMMALDLVTYLPDDILTKVDRAAMAASLETRVPFLDHEVVEFAWSLPQEYKLRRSGRGFEAKWPVRRLLERYIPRELIERPKMGFGVPVKDWLRGPLRDWASHYLDPQRIAQEGFLDPLVVSQAWREHLSGKRDWHAQLWAILMFQTWNEAQHGPS